jgi:hypothetical protein
MYPSVQKSKSRYQFRDWENFRFRPDSVIPTNSVFSCLGVLPAILKRLGRFLWASSASESFGSHCLQISGIQASQSTQNWWTQKMASQRTSSSTGNGWNREAGGLGGACRERAIQFPRRARKRDRRLASHAANRWAGKARMGGASWWWEALRYVALW